MRSKRIQRAHAGRSAGRRCAGCARIAGLAGLLAAAAGCNGDEAWNAFRNAASSSLQSGFRSVATGVVDGLFAVFELGADRTAGGSTGSGDSTAAGDGG